jgi:predicted PolB exonuclease-like 3'-5' exonuclease
MRSIFKDSGELRSILAFDIETRIHERATEYIEKTKEYSAPSNYKNEEAKQKYIEAAKKKEILKAAINIPTHRIWVISAYDMDTNECQSFFSNSEEEIITDFFRMLATKWSSHVLVGYNSDRFDIPVLKGAALRCNVPVPKHLRFPALQDDVIHDFKHLKISLADVGHMIGMGKSMNGAEVHQYWLAHTLGDKQALRKVVDYCELDVVHVVEYIRRVYDTETIPF